MSLFREFASSQQPLLARTTPVARHCEEDNARRHLHLPQVQVSNLKTDRNKISEKTNAEVFSGIASSQQTLLAMTDK
jgi:hypothetical protein